MIGYSDSDSAGDSIERNSTSGYFFTKNGDAVPCRSKRQILGAPSRQEAEYASLSHASREAMSPRKLFQEAERSKSDFR